MRYASRSSSSGSRFSSAVWLLLLPRVVSDFRLVQFATVGIYFIAILGLNFLTGYSGQISLGHGAFMAIGGYTSAILIVHHGWSDLDDPSSPGWSAGVAGPLFGIPALRPERALPRPPTFSLAVSMPSIHQEVGERDGGLERPARERLPHEPLVLHRDLDHGRHPLRARRAAAETKFSRAWRAIRDSEVAAASMGIDLAVYKTLAFGISALYAGVAGALLVILSFGANPGSFPIQLSIYLVVGLAVPVSAARSGGCSSARRSSNTCRCGRPSSRSRPVCPPSCSAWRSSS